MGAAETLVAVAAIRVNCGCCGLGLRKAKVIDNSPFANARIEGIPGKSQYESETAE